MQDLVTLQSFSLPKEQKPCDSYDTIISIDVVLVNINSCLHLLITCAYTFTVDNIAAIKHQIEYLFLKKIIAGLRDGSISVVAAKEYANAFLAIEPFTSIEDAYNKINQFVLEHSEFSILKDYMDAFEKEKDVAAKIDKMREHIKQNNIDAALIVARE